jgi:hypothetical protein
MRLKRSEIGANCIVGGQAVSGNALIDVEAAPIKQSRRGEFRRLQDRRRLERSCVLGERDTHKIDCQKDD